MQLKSKVMQVGILLHTVGAEAQDVHETVDNDVDEDKDDYELVVTKFRTYCQPRKNIAFERYQFWCRNQSEGEPVDQWVTDLRKHKNGQVRLQDSQEWYDFWQVFEMHDTRIKESLLSEADLTLTRAVDVWRAAESIRKLNFSTF